MRAFYFWMIFWIILLAVLVGILAVGVLALWEGWHTFRPVGSVLRSELPVDGPAGPKEAWEGESDSSVGPVLYRIRCQWRADVGTPTALTVDAKDRIYVAGQKRIQIFDSSGQLLGQWEIREPPRCLAAASPEQVRPGCLYIGYPGRVEIRSENGVVVGGWPLPGERAEPTSIALGQKEIFVADATAKCVQRFDAEGRLLGQLAKADPSRGYPGLIIPSAYCDVAVDPQGLLWVVNPGLRRLEAYRPADGRLERFWGGQDLEGPAAFFGCCNPAHFCLLPDGRFVTAEKGLLRLKVYENQGSWEGWVVRPEEWNRIVRTPPGVTAIPESAHCLDRMEVADVATDSQGRVIVLYLANSTVYLFDPISTPSKPPPLEH